jgi:hypothetical protein
MEEASERNTAASTPVDQVQFNNVNISIPHFPVCIRDAVGSNVRFVHGYDQIRWYSFRESSRDIVEQARRIISRGP